MGDLNGTYSRPYNWTNEAAATNGIDPGKFDADGNQVAAALNSRLPSDGSRAASADLPMAQHTLTGCRPGAAAGEPVTFDQFSGNAQATAFAYCAALVF